MSQTAAKPFVRLADEGDSYNMFGALTRVKASGEETDGLVGLVEQQSLAGFATPLHVHHADDELFYVVEGHVTYYVDDEVIEAPAGTTVYGPKGVPHAFRVDEDGTRWLDIRRAGEERFFGDVGTPTEVDALPNPPAPTPEDLERLGAVSDEYHLEILGPSPLVESE